MIYMGAFQHVAVRGRMLLFIEAVSLRGAAEGIARSKSATKGASPRSPMPRTKSAMVAQCWEALTKLMCMPCTGLVKAAVSGT